MRPERVVLIVGTGTEVGKTWVAARLLEELRRGGATVAARKPAQSFDVDLEGRPLGGPTDAEELAAASGEHPGEVCHAYRSYHRAMAPPMAAEALGLPPFTVADLVNELEWPNPPPAWGLVETAGGVRSPQAADGDGVDLLGALGPDVVVLVADAGLGTLNGIRLTLEALGPTCGPGQIPVVVVLDRYDDHHDLHHRNRRWLAERQGIETVVLPGDEAELAARVAAAGSGRMSTRPDPTRP